MTAQQLDKLRSDYAQARGDYVYRLEMDRQLAQATDTLLNRIDDVSHERLRIPTAVSVRAYDGTNAEEFIGTLPEFVGLRRSELEPLANSYNCTIVEHPYLKNRFIVRWMFHWENNEQYLSEESP